MSFFNTVLALLTSLVHNISVLRYDLLHIASFYVRQFSFCKQTRETEIELNIACCYNCNCCII